MKKLHFSLMAIFFALFAMVSFTACSSDDDTPSEEYIKGNIIGKWIPTHVTGWEYIGSNYDPSTTDESSIIKQVDKDLTSTSGQDEYDAITFKSDFTCYYSYFSKYANKWSDDSHTYTYRISGNKITIYYNSKEIEETFTVISLNDKNMVVEGDLDADEFPGKKVRLTYTKY